jgi:hypothetical protein
MKRQQLSIALVAAAAVTLGAGSAWSQDRGRPQSERPSSGDSAGSAVPRGGGGDSGSSSSSAAGSGSSTSSPAGSSGSDSAGTASSPWMGAPVRERAPVRPDRAERAEQSQRRGGGSSSGSSGRAVPRGEAGGRDAGSAGSTSSSAGAERQPAEGRNRAVPTYSRPRDGRAPVGTAVERTTPIDRGGGGNNYRRGYYYDPYYSFYYDPYYTGHYSYWSPFGYGYGLGYFSYDPFLFSGYGYGYPNSYGADPYYGGGAGAGYGSRYSQAYRGVGSLRLKVKPANAQVYIDGYYVGVIDSFDGAFQKLSVEGGAHRVELRADGYESVEFEVMVTPGDTITYKGEMKSK